MLTNHPEECKKRKQRLFWIDVHKYTVNDRMKEQLSQDKIERKMRMKKLISVLLAIVLLTSVMTVGVAEKKKTSDFTGKLSVKAATLVKPGSVVKIQAKVKKANLAYTINWERYLPEKDEWEKVAEDKDSCTFEAEEAGVFVFRAALKAEDGSKLYKKVKKN